MSQHTLPTPQGRRALPTPQGRLAVALFQIDAIVDESSAERSEALDAIWGILQEDLLREQIDTELHRSPAALEFLGMTEPPIFPSALRAPRPKRSTMLITLTVSAAVLALTFLALAALISSAAQP